MLPAQSAAACGQATWPENRKIMTALAFMTPASAFLVAPAFFTAMPASVSAASIRKPIPPPK